MSGGASVKGRAWGVPRARRPGYYCPTPALELPCPPGEWCTQAAVAPTTCEYPALMARQPEKTVPDEPLTIVQRVYAKGEPLGGNICPPVRARTPCATPPGSGSVGGAGLGSSQHLACSPRWGHDSDCKDEGCRSVHPPL